MTTNHLVSTEVICHECALKVSLPVLAEGEKAHCPRCNYLLTANRKNSQAKVISFSLTAIIFWLLSLSFEFLSFSSNGIEREITITQSIQVLIEHKYWALAVIQTLAVFTLPIIILSLLLILYIPMSMGRLVPGSAVFMKILHGLLPWSMAEIFVVGTLVSLVKIMSMADIGFGPSFYSFILFNLAMTMALVNVDKHELTSFIVSQHDKVDHHLIHHKANHNSVQFTWALLVTSCLLYIPANVLPIMNTRLLGQDDPSTILGGVVLLWQLESYPVAIIIFVASIAIPIAKIVALCWLNYSVQHASEVKQQERIKIYRITEFIGRWSMIDVFVVILLVSLIQLGNTMSIYPGAAALSFCGVVVLTMLAAMSFDTQLIWNNKKAYE